MPWKGCSVVDERLRFVAQLLDGEPMTEVCRAFGISRKTGYKIFDRYKEHGLEALNDRSRRPVRYANQLPQLSELEQAPGRSHCLHPLGWQGISTTQWVRLDRRSQCARARPFLTRR